MNHEMAAKLARFLESNWSEELSEAMSEQLDAALGFALARAVHEGWVVGTDAMDANLQAAADFMNLVGDET